MILNMSGAGGAGLNFAVKAYASESALPATAKENTVAVITETEITSWHFDSAEPAAPAEGMAWIKTGAAGVARINVLKSKSNALYVYPNACSQYIGGAWVAKYALLYTGSEWQRWEAWLVANGKAAYTINAIGKGWENGHAAMPSQTVTETAGALEIKANGAGNGMAYVDPIDLSNYSTMTIEGAFKLGAGAMKIAVWSGIGTYINQNIVLSADLTATGATLDVSSLDGEYIVGIALSGAYTQIVENWWLA